MQGGQPRVPQNAHGHMLTEEHDYVSHGKNVDVYLVTSHGGTGLRIA